MGLFLCKMLTARRHRYLTRWPHRLAFALVILLLLSAGWRVHYAWQSRSNPAPEPLTQAV
jgi:hypothetical protein